jgi:non-specific serine/threonine protein kinase/serine/threonine-protein kinase
MASNEPAIHPCLTDDELSRFHARELAEPDLSVVRDHLARCEECATRGERLLAEHETWIRELRRVGAPPEAPRPVPTSGTAELKAQDLCGYEILEEVSRGGQGIIYRGVQESTKREVAVKVLREGAYASPAARKRFEREIELIAGLRHPNIVTVFDSGRTRDGRRYLVMDFVRGQPLHRHLRSASPPLHARLALFGRICTAVNAAHQRGVIHRDLKPSNILVSEAGEPFVLDFGLARQVTVPGETAMTATGEVAGTLPYMSPEQARGLPDAVDIRSDVYSLGLILYEMLTGTFPYPVEGDPIQVLKHIAETPPTLPNQYRAPRGDRALEPSEPSRRQAAWQIDHDLQTIVLKALAKEPERRYQTAGDLARDIERYLAGEVIEAKRDSSLYLLRKSLQRYRLGVAFALTIVLLITVSAVALGVMYAKQARLRAEAEHQTALAQAAEHEARARFGDVRELANFFVMRFDNQIKRLPGSAAARQALVEKGLQYLELLARDSQGDPELQYELATAYMSIGNVQGELQASNLGDLDGALESYNNAARLLDAVRRARPDSAAVASTFVLNLLRTGDVLLNMGDRDGVFDAYRDALNRARQVSGSHPGDMEALGLLSNALERMGNILALRGELDEALAHFEESREVYSRIPDEFKDAFGYEQQKVAGLMHLGDIQYQQGKRDEALATYQAAHAFAERLFVAHPDDRASLRCAAVSGQWIGIILNDLGRHDEAIEAFRPAISVLEQTLRGAPDDQVLQLDLATTLSKQGEAQMARGQREAARDSYARSLELVEQGARRWPEFAALHRLKGVAYYKMAELSNASADDEGLTPGERLEHWRTARLWLVRCRDVFLDMRERGLLTSSDAGVPDELTVEIEDIERTIEQLEQPPTTTETPS